MPENFSLKDVNVNEISVLLRIMRGETNLTNIAHDLGITLQGVRYYIMAMNERKLLENLKITPTGYEYLTSVMKILKEFVAEGNDAIFKANDWETISDNNIKSGERVNLKMENGFLHAQIFKDETAAMAIATEDSTTGNLLRVRDVSGIIKINFGTIHIKVIDNLSQDNAKSYREHLKIDVDKLGNSIEKFLLGEGVYSLIGNNLKLHHFSPLHSAFDAANRGVSALVYATQEAMNLNFDEFSLLKEKYPEIKTEVSIFEI